MAAEVPVTDDVDAEPFPELPLEDVIKNPFRLRMIHYDNQSKGWWKRGSNGILRRGPQDSETYGYIDPEAGAFITSSFHNLARYSALMDGWAMLDNGDKCGLKPNGVVYPFPSIGWRNFFSSNFQDGGRAWDLGYGSNGMIALVESSSGMRIAWRHSAFGLVVPTGSGEYYHNEGLVEMVRPWGHVETQDAIERNRLNVIHNNEMLDFPSYIYEGDPGLLVHTSTMYHWGKDPVTDWRGNTKYLKTLTVWQVSGYRWAQVGDTWENEKMTATMTIWLGIMRTDLDPSVFDFDEEMRRATRNAQGDP